MVLRVGVTVRLAGIATLGCLVPVLLTHTDPAERGATLGYAAALGATGALVLALWWRDGAVRRYTLVIDLTIGSAILAGASTDPMRGWAYMYAVMVCITLGLRCRSVGGALLSGCVWGSAILLGASGYRDPVWNAPGIMVSFLVFPLVGWLALRLFTRGAAEIELGRAAAARQAAALATERERVAHVRALHDHVLQTMEVLLRGDLVTDAGLRERLQDRADWLRRYVETGDADQRDDLATGLRAAVRAAVRAQPDADPRIDLNDAALRFANVVPEVPADRREALIEATHDVLSVLAGDARNVVTRVELPHGGVLVTVLADDDARLPEPARLETVRASLAQVGGTLTVDRVPYLELWVPLPSAAAGVSPPLAHRGEGPGWRRKRRVG